MSFSHLKGDWPHLTAITDPAALDSELARIRTEYNTVRLHAAIGYVTPDDEHHGRGPAIRRARAAGMRRARAERIKHNRLVRTQPRPFRATVRSLFEPRGPGRECAPAGIAFAAASRALRTRCQSSRGGALTR